MTALLSDSLSSLAAFDDQHKNATEGLTSARQDTADTQDRRASGTNFPDSHKAIDTHLADAVGEPSSTTGQTNGDTQPGAARGGHGSLPASVRALPKLTPPVGSNLPQPEAISPTRPKSHAPRVADPTLALLADVLGDLEATRIANENRLRQLTRTETDIDGEDRGFGLDESHPDVARLAGVVDGIKALEHQATLNLQRSIRKHPLGPWVKHTIGVGEKQGARLIATLGDPYWNDLHDRPRTVSELWAYCGVHVVNGAAAARARGVKSNWNADAKMRAYLVATSCIKALESPYRAVYDEGRAKYAETLHGSDCKRCGPSGKPALEGSPLSAGHQHARAMRLMMKAILRDLWAESRDIHQNFLDGQVPGDTQTSAAVEGPTSGAVTA